MTVKGIPSTRRSSLTSVKTCSKAWRWYSIAATSIDRMTLPPWIPFFEMAKPFYFITLLHLSTITPYLPPLQKKSANLLSCIILIGWLVVKCIPPWNFLKGLFSKLQYSIKPCKAETRQKTRRSTSSWVWQYCKCSQFGNNYLQLNCWTWIDPKCSFQTGFMTACGSMFQHFSLFDNDRQRSSVTLANKYWGVYWLCWLPLGMVMRKADVKLYSQVVFYQFTVLTGWSQSL